MIWVKISSPRIKRRNFLVLMLMTLFLHLEVMIYLEDETTSLLNEGDIFVGGLGKDTVVLDGSEDDYILMSKVQNLIFIRL